MSEHGFPTDDARLLVERALDEDLGDGTDVTTVATIPAEQESVSHLVARADGVVAGLPVVGARRRGRRRAARHRGRVGRPARGRRRRRGARRPPRDAARLHPHHARSPSGPILNVLSRTSGVATHTRRWADVLDGSGAMVLDTEKTTPGIRALEKYAVRCGGGTNKRMGLYDVAMIKDNHSRSRPVG